MAREKARTGARVLTVYIVSSDSSDQLVVATETRCVCYRLQVLTRCEQFLTKLRPLLTSKHVLTGSGYNKISSKRTDF